MGTLTPDRGGLKGMDGGVREECEVGDALRGQVPDVI